MHNGFNAESTANDILSGIDLTGKRILITGISSGLGKETARVLLKNGASVIGTARNSEKASITKNLPQFQSFIHSGNFESKVMDLSSLASIRQLSTELLQRNKTFDVIIANAGVMACPKGMTSDGFETHFGTNHLGHFHFLNQISQQIKLGGKLVVLSSSAHRFGDIELNDLNYEQSPYNEFIAYARSKTANILFAVAFDRRHREKGIRATAIHPGVIKTELTRHVSDELTKKMVESANEKRSERGLKLSNYKSLNQGTATTVWASIVAPSEAIGGRYCEDCNVANIDDDCDSPSGVRSYALNPEKAELLWEKSQKMVEALKDT